METLKLGFVGIIQGISELLPISSSAHMLLLGELLKINVTSSLLILFHLGTTVAVIIFLRKQLFKNLFSKKKLLFYIKILIATLPAGIVGFLFNDIISKHLRKHWILAISLILWGIVMIVLEARKDKKEEIKKEKVSTVENITLKQAFLIGLSQTIALIPGTSRSGITTIAGIFLGLPKYVALKFSFTLSIPVLLGSFAWFLAKSFKSTNGISAVVTQPIYLNFLTIFLTTFIFGLISMKLLRKAKKKKWLTFFGIYRIILGIVVLSVSYL